MDAKQIIMNFSVPPSLDDIEAIANDVMDSLPDELMEFIKGIELCIEDFPDELTEQELELDDPYELLALYKSGKEISPGVEKKIASEDDVIILYRRPVLDMWCDSGEDLKSLVRRIIVEELGRNFDFPDEEISDMVDRHHQGML